MESSIYNGHCIIKEYANGSEVVFEGSQESVARHLKDIALSRRLSIRQDFNLPTNFKQLRGLHKHKWQIVNASTFKIKRSSPEELCEMINETTIFPYRYMAKQNIEI